MGEKLVIGPINRGVQTNRTAFNIDNDSFPTLINAYQWRGRVKRKRGTEFICRLQRYITGSAFTNNLLTGLEATASLVPGSISVVSMGITWTDPGSDGILVRSPIGPSGTVNYITGVLTGPTAPTTGSFTYYPGLPVLGIEDLVVDVSDFQGTLAFDNKYSYNISTVSPFFVSDVSYYKNLPTGTYPSYVQKSASTPTTWNGNNYQQFWTVNYQGALWATNGIDVPFTGNNISMQFQKPLTASGTADPTIATFTINNCPLVIGDFVFANEYTGTGHENLDFHSGYVLTVATVGIVSTITVKFPNATIPNSAFTPGILQYLTNRSDVTKDCLRWYDGSPVTGNPPVPVPGKGWVNFAPPLSYLGYSISDQISDIYYLVGARLIVPFKDRLLFLGPVIQSSGGSKFYLQDTVIYSQNGTAYYTTSFPGGDPRLSDTVFTPILVPTGQTATAPAWFEDATGFGGFLAAGIDRPIITAAFNEDVLVVGFTTFQTRLAYSGVDFQPFNFFSINTEYGSSSTFSVITMDEAVLTRGDRGYIMTSQTNCQRIDLDNPDQVFEVNLNSNGNERFCAGRDFINEWIYFTYNSNGSVSLFPNQTFQFNYRDQSWAIIDESYTTYGQFKKSSGESWEDVPYASWDQWNDPWNAGENTEFQPIVLGGNQQGFILQKGVSTGEGTSLMITGFSGNIVTCINHGLNNNDYILITGCLGTIGAQVNGKIFSVNVNTAGVDSFSLLPNVTTGTYLGGGLITRIYVPQIQTRQFPVSWQLARKTRIGVQQYLLTTTYNSQISLYIYLSQNASSPYNLGPLFPADDATNNGLVYSTVLYTCPESTNLGLTPINTNLQMVTADQQEQIWHRINTSLIGDTVQLGFTLSDDQIRDVFVTGVSFPITGATQANPCVLTCAGSFENGTIIQITGILGMTQLNGNSYQVLSSDDVEVTIDVDSTAFDVYISDGTATPVAGSNAFAEIELHSIVLDVTPSMVLA